MRNRALRGCLTAAILVIMPAVGTNSKEVRGHPPQKLTRQQTNPAEKESPPNPDKRGTAELPLVVRPLATEKTQQEAEEDARNRYDKRWNDGATLVIGFATLLILTVQARGFFVQAIRLQQTIEAMKKIGADQSRDMQASIAVAKEAAEAAMKAARISEIALESAETPYLYPIVRQFSKEDGDGSPFSYAFENFGRSPAIVREIYDGSIVSRGLPAVIGFPPPQSNLGKSHIVAAGKCSPWRNMGIPTVGDTNAAVWLIGQVRYSDVFGNQFLSGFCFALNSVSLAFTAYGGVGYNYRRKLTDQERELAETRDADPLVAVAP